MAAAIDKGGACPRGASARGGCGGRAVADPMLGGMKSSATVLAGAPDLHSGKLIRHARGVLHSGWTRQAGPDEQPADGRALERDPLALGEQLGEVAVVHPDVRRRGEFDHAMPELVVDPVGGRPAPVAVGERRRTVGVAGDQAVDLTGRKAEDLRPLVERQAASDDVMEDVGAVLTPRVGLGLSVLGFHAPEGDKVAGRLARTVRWPSTLPQYVRCPSFGPCAILPGRSRPDRRSVVPCTVDAPPRTKGIDHQPRPAHQPDDPDPAGTGRR